MRSIATALAALLLVGPTSGLAAQSGTTSTGPKLGFIDSQAILQEAPGAQEAQQQFERDMARYRSEVEQMGQELQTLISNYEQQQLTLSPAAKENREEQIRLKQQEYQQRVQELENQAAQRQAELVEPIMEKINTVIDGIRREGEFTMIFDVASQAIIAADPSLDLTAEVIRRLKSANGETGTPGGREDSPDRD